MTPTRLRTLALLALLGGVAGALLAATAYGSLPDLPRVAPVSLALLAVVELAMARVVRDRVQRRARPGARTLHPLQVARAAALAKASSPTGALLGGVYLGLLLWLLPSELRASGPDRVVAGLSALAAGALVVAALLLERACRTPDREDEPPALGSRA